MKEVILSTSVYFQDDTSDYKQLVAKFESCSIAMEFCRHMNKITTTIGMSYVIK